MNWFIFICIFLLASCGSSSDEEPTTGGDVEPVTNPPDDQPLPGTDPPPAVPTINRDNHEAVLLDIFKVFTGESFSDRFDQIPVDVGQFGDVITPAVIDDFDPANSTPGVYSCANGGTVDALVAEGDFSDSTELTFANCQVGALLLQGDYRIFVGGSEDFSSSDGHASRDGLDVDFGTGVTMTFKGRYDNGCCTERFSSISHSFSDDFSLTIDNAGEVLIISAGNSEFTSGNGPFDSVYTASMTGGFNVVSPASMGSVLTANVVSDFSYESAEDLSSEEFELLASTWTFETGVLKVVAEDGSEVELVAESGDPATARITVRNSDGDETFDQPWSLWMDTLTSFEIIAMRKLLAYGH